MFDMNAMMGKVKEAQQKLKEAQDNLVNITAEGDAGAGMVKATVNGKKQVIAVDFDESLLNKDDKNMLQDLTVAAINKAIENIEPKVADAMQDATSGMMPNMPGMDLGEYDEFLNGQNSRRYTQLEWRTFLKTVFTFCSFL